MEDVDAAKAKIPDTVHILLIGEGAAGKTSLIKSFNNEGFIYSYFITLGFDFATKKIRIDDRAITVYIWDTPGQNHMNHPTKSLYQRADGIMVVYDVTSESSYDQLMVWIERMNEMASKVDMEAVSYTHLTLPTICSV
eukprot:TRINITY_DN8790_c0_g1_i14.p1 TRINITY_DN8790_c0_g1~~TRINITY_DN8790_c0_g1_i14.p1  ORF type:complete len:138 (-),score=25.17 TRINITY_DN8790_c0_g1_i14:35-448(-)